MEEFTGIIVILVLSSLGFLAIFKLTVALFFLIKIIVTKIIIPVLRIPFLIPYYLFYAFPHRFLINHEKQAIKYNLSIMKYKILSDLKNKTFMLLQPAATKHNLHISKKQATDYIIQKYFSDYVNCSGSLQKLISNFLEHNLFYKHSSHHQNWAKLQNRFEETFPGASLIAGRAKDKIYTSRLDHIDPWQFENLMERYYRSIGYSVQQTSMSNDQGVDLILEKDGKRIAVQLKKWKDNSIGSGVLRELIGGTHYYKCNSAICITSSHYSKPAKEYASVLSQNPSPELTLIDQEDLKRMLADFISKQETKYGRIASIQSNLKELYLKFKFTLNEKYHLDRHSDKISQYHYKLDHIDANLKTFSNSLDPDNIISLADHFSTPETSIFYTG